MNQQYFTDSEWIVLQQAPMKAIQLVTLADKADPVSFLQETYLAIQIFSEEQQKEHSNDLVKALLAALKAADAEAPHQGEDLILTKEFQYLNELRNFKDANEGRTQSIDHLKQVSSILNDKVTLNQAQEFRQWLVSLAERVAESVKESGAWRGIGGERISKEESAAIREVERALAVR